MSGTTVNPCKRTNCFYYRDYVAFGSLVTILDRRSRWEKLVGGAPKGYTLPVCRDCKHFERFDLFEDYDLLNKGE